MFSIDQNCHSLWDALPKVQALARRGMSVRHFIEDIDVAFTAVGATPDQPLRFALERFYGSGGGDWGAALFYSEFLGRLPVEIRAWEAYTGLKTAALARLLEVTVDDLYDRYSPGDNWQLIGPSYAGDRDHHRLIADLTVAELTDLLFELTDRAEHDMRTRFPSQPSQDRIGKWFASERGLLADLVSRHLGGSLVDLYHDWMAGYLAKEPRVSIELSSDLLAIGADPGATGLLDSFVSRYDEVVAIYNEAMTESDTGLHILDTKAGELPFFATLQHQGHWVRSEVFRTSKGLRVGDQEFALSAGHLPIDAMRRAGVQCLTGKAALLVLQARISGGGTGLALPYHGSTYMPAVHALHRRLEAADMLPGPVGPLMRVRFRLLDRMASLETPIALPEHLVTVFGTDELQARDLAANWGRAASGAAERLERLQTEDGRNRWQQSTLRPVFDQIELLDARRRDLAKRDAKSSELRDLSHRVRRLQTDVAARTLEQIACDYQAAHLDFWDSRGALLPWCVALGGKAFYDGVISQAEVYEESHQDH